MKYIVKQTIERYQEVDAETQEEAIAKFKGNKAIQSEIKYRASKGVLYYSPAFNETWALYTNNVACKIVKSKE